MAAVGALNRRDDVWAVEAGRALASNGQMSVVAIEACAEILLRGVPHGALDPSEGIPVTCPPLPGHEARQDSIDAASEPLTGLACGDDQRVVTVLVRFAQDRMVDLLLVLVGAAAAWVDAYVGVDGDTVDAYYSLSKS